MQHCNLQRMLQMSNLIGSVGNAGKNISSDVMKVQELLNKKIDYLKPLKALKVDGKCGPLTIGLIKDYQTRVLCHKRPDGKIDPKGPTLESLLSSQMPTVKAATSKTVIISQSQTVVSKTINPLEAPSTSNLLTEADYEFVSQQTGLEVALIKAVGYSETGESSFFQGRPKILFEGHYFYNFTNGKYAKSHPNICYESQGRAKYGTYNGEHEKLTLARSLDEDAALKSASWGRFQIMGANFKNVGWKCIKQFVKDMETSEKFHLKAFVGYLEHRDLIGALKSHRWEEFARRYNGDLYKKNAYDIKLQAAYEAFRK